MWVRGFNFASSYDCSIRFRNCSDSVGFFPLYSSVVGVNDPSSVNADTSLEDLGLDSLMGEEVKRTLERDFDTSLSMREIRKLTMSKLKGMSSSGITGEAKRIEQTRGLEKNSVL